MSAVVAVAPGGLLTVAEVCAALRIAPSTLYRWVDEGDVPADAVLRVGNGRRRGVRIRTWWVAQYQERGEMPRVRKIGRRRA